MGLTANSVTNPKTMLCLSCFADSDKEFSSMPIDCSLNTQCVPARSKEQLKKKAISHLRMLQKKPGRVKKYFKHSKIAYAA
jgi:hypothetical protein